MANRGDAGSEAKMDFDEFVLGSSGRLLRTAQLLTGDAGRAEDLVQDAYARAYLRWDRIRADDPWAYVRRCVVNGYTDWWRRRRWHRGLTASCGQVVPAGTTCPQREADLEWLGLVPTVPHGGAVDKLFPRYRVLHRLVALWLSRKDCGDPVLPGQWRA